jgi:hypothetical protein
MPASSKVAAPKTTKKTTAKKTSKAPAKRTAKPSTEPFLRFYHSETLRAKTLAILTTIEKAKDGKPHRDALGNVVVELTGSGMEYFFLRPLKLAKVGFLTEQSANLGMSAATGLMASAIRTIIGRMDRPQLLAVCGYVRQLMK